MNLLSCHIKSMLFPSSLYGYPLNINDHHGESKENEVFNLGLINKSQNFRKYL